MGDLMEDIKKAQKVSHDWSIWKFPAYVVAEQRSRDWDKIIRELE